MIKKFEQMEFNEDWAEEDPDYKNKGPFDDQLIYGRNGPSFKCGDMVKYIFNGEIGTVVDNNVNGVDFRVLYNMPDGHGWWCSKTEIELT